METIVFIHGIGASRNVWAPQLEQLSSHYTTVAVDLPGHGLAPGPFTFDAAVETLSPHLENDAGVHLVGMSAGAAVALLACLDNPHAVSSVVLSAPVVSPPDNLTARRIATRLLPTEVLSAGIARGYNGHKAAFRDTAARDMRRCGRKTLRQAVDELAKLDLRRRLREIHTPTLVVCGASDHGNVAAARDTATRIDGALWQTVPHAGRLWNLEQPEYFNRAVSQFVDTAAN